MKLKSLEIKLQPAYSDNPGKYIAEIEYEGQRGAIRLTLDVKVSEALMVCVGRAITEFSHRASLALESEIEASLQEARQVPVIENTTT